MRALQRTVVLAALIALGVALFYMGREHQVFLDNKTTEADGKTFKALERVNVSVAGGEPMELLKRDRDVVKVVGPSFALKVEVLDSMGGSVEQTLERTLNPGFGKDLMISLPLLAAGREDFILPPPTVQAPAPEEAPAAPSEEGLPVAGMEPTAEGAGDKAPQ